MTFTITWTQTATLVGAFFAVQGAFVYHMDRRFADLVRYMDARFKAVEDRLDRIEKRLVNHKERV